MQSSDLDLDSPVFAEHPQGWRSPNQVFDGFLLCWALEMQVRRQIAPENPLQDLAERLPSRFMHDSLGGLVGGFHAADARWFSGQAVPRLVAFAAAARVYERFEPHWSPLLHDWGRYSSALAEATGGADRLSVFQELHGNVARGLLAARVERAYSGSLELSSAEEWFAKGDEELLRATASGSAPSFLIGGTPVPVPITADELKSSVWSCARVLVRAGDVGEILERYSSQRGQVEDILDRGCQRAEGIVELGLNPRFQNLWPGWS